MKVGFVGLGKLGMPCAVAMAMKGHEVVGYDSNPECMTKEPRPYLETGPDGKSEFNPFLAESSIRFGSLAELAAHSEVIFVAVPTPHDPKYEGITRLPDERKDFDYQYLVESIRSLREVITRDTAVVVISTVLPGTIRSEVIPELNSHMKLGYNPYFIAMGTTMQDFLNAEIVLFGSDHAEVSEKMKRFYGTVTSAPFYSTTIENAELIKVAYNTFIGMKITFANTLMEVCHRIPGTDVDAVTDALKLATTRIISGRYLSGGMGDGGGCHPRDNIALSWLARKLNLSFDWFEAVMGAREKQTEWLVSLMEEYRLPKAIFGYSYKPETNLTMGSPALLLKNILEERGHAVLLHDPIVEGKLIPSESLRPHVFLIGTKHEIFAQYRFPPGSVVIDPWRYLPPNPEILLIPLGGASKSAACLDGEEKIGKDVVSATTVNE